MSSEISTEPQGLASSRVNRGRIPEQPAPSAFEPWQLFTLAGLIGATIAVFMARGQSPAAVILISLTIFAAAAVGVAALRTVLPLTQKTPSAGPQVLGGRTRAALEREKTLALRSIKDLEFDRAMGKVSEKDFAEMSARLRARAARLIRQLDAAVGYRAEIEREIEKRIGPVAAASVAQPAARPARAESKGEPAAPSAGGAACAACGTANDPDARFCKHCGKALEAGA